MSDDLVKRLQDPPFGTETSERNLMAQAAAALVAKDAEIARLTRHLRAADEYLDKGLPERARNVTRAALSTQHKEETP